ncbi:MAG: hypothetical protein ROW39_00930 [Anaerolineaceae bacterium]|jgi:hypothetical protein
MIRAYIESLLGEWGRALLSFYDQYSLAINLVIVIYGLCIVLSWVNLKHIRKSLIISISEQLRKRAALSGTSLSKKDLSALPIPWEDAIQRSRFPFIAAQNALVPRRLTIQKVQALLPVADLVDEALALLKAQTKSRI